MHDWRKTLISPDTTIRTALKVVDESSMQVTLVVDEERRLLGIVTDGDVRRGILKDVGLDEPVSKIMFTQCTVAGILDSREQILELMRAKQIRQIPVVDDSGRVVDLRLFMDMTESPRRDNEVVLMAGGLGSRLQPLTDDCPKPLLNVGGRPILETIMLGFMDYGFHNFHISVNYKAEMIESHFGDGSRWNVDISYLRENKRMGTAGCLSLFPKRPEQSFMVMNGDLLTRVNFEQMLAFHAENQAAATMAIRQYDYEVPFGVVEVDGQRIVSLHEKPVQRFFVNAGVYVLEPHVLDHLAPETTMDMPELFQFLMDKGEKTCAFPIHEYWLDIGRMGDYDRANGDFCRHFGDQDQ